MHRIPNALTFLRLGLAPLLAIALCGRSLTATWTALAIAFLMELTDWLDGFLARRYSWQTALGRFLDPLADSIARMTAFVALHSTTGAPTLPMLLVFLYRDQLVAYLRIDAAQRGVDVGARRSGKLKAVVQALAIVGTCVGKLLSHSAVGWIEPATSFALSWWLMGFAALVTLFSGVDYARSLGARTNGEH